MMKMEVFMVKPLKHGMKGSNQPIILFKTRVTIYNRYLVPNFDTRMSITKFASMTDEIQNLINASSMHMARNLHIYLKMVLIGQSKTDRLLLHKTRLPTIRLKRRVPDKE